MKKIIPFTLFLIVCFSAYLASYQSTKDIDITTPTVKLDKYTRADLAIQQEFEMTKDPQTGEVPRERLWKAREYIRTMQGMKGKAAISGITWSERGPSNVSGRTRTVMFDPNDPSGKRVFAGSVGGGLWVTDDIYAATTSWTNVDEFLDNMAITSIAHDPSNSDIMYFGTGEGFFNIDAIRGDGIFKSTDGGDSWTQLSSSSAYSYVQKLAIDSSGNIYAATLNSGVVKSTDGGVSWSTVLSSTIPGSGTNSSYNRASDVEIASNGDIYVSMGIFISDGIYKSTDDGTTWSKVYTPTSEERIEIACAPTDSNYIYALSQDASVNDAENFLRSTNGGTSWDTLSPPSSFSAQTWYNIGLSVDPNDETNVFVGGLDLWKSTNSGGSFSKVSYWSGSPYVHADHHSIVFAQGSSDTILFGNDGGVFLTTNGSS
ncbi:MAG: WD40/YVTN/BNR-like repeat-containing protein, partial [Bacteroidia bacterium]